jgi:GTP-binding protein
MYDWIKSQGYQPVIIATKLDKIKRSQLSKQVNLIRTTLKASKDTVIIPFSAQTKQGRDEIYGLLDALLSETEAKD